MLARSNFNFLAKRQRFEKGAPQNKIKKSCFFYGVKSCCGSNNGGVRIAKFDLLYGEKMIFVPVSTQLPDYFRQLKSFYFWMIVSFRFGSMFDESVILIYCEVCHCCFLAFFGVGGPVSFGCTLSVSPQLGWLLSNRQTTSNTGISSPPVSPYPGKM
jgi:hypothetical protein